MSRIRTIKPEFFLNDELAELSPLTRLLFIGLWTLADCKGRMEDRPKRIRAQLHPFDDGDTDAMLQSLHEGRFITRYEVNGKRYLEITTFTKHQRLTGKEVDAISEIPAPQQSTGDQGENWGNIGETLGKDFSFTNAQEGKGKEGKGKGREEEAPQAACASPTFTTDAPEAIEEAPKDTARLKTTRAKGRMTSDWTPAETTYALLEKHGIPRAFAEGCIDEFRLYWQERGESRPGWEASFVNNAKRQWAHRPREAIAKRNSQLTPQPRDMTPEMAEWDAILRGLKPASPVIEGECHATH